jgi:hypothetical protein
LGTNRNCLASGKNQLSYLFTKRVIKLSVVIIGAYHCCQLHTKFYPTFFSLGQFLMQMKLLGIANVDFDVIGQRLIRSVSLRYWRKK